jgi:hypothetical protein
VEIRDIAQADSDTEELATWEVQDTSINVDTASGGPSATDLETIIRNNQSDLQEIKASLNSLIIIILLYYILNL